MSDAIMTGWDTRFSYVNVIEPKGINGGKEKYSVSLIIPKSNALIVKRIKNAIRETYEENKNKLKGNSKSIPTLEEVTEGVLHDGDVKRDGDPAYENAYYINAKNDRKPQLFTKGKEKGHPEELMDPAEIYSGCYGRALIQFFAYNTSGGRGIACSLVALQKGKDGEPLGSFIDAAKAFEADDDEEDDDDFLS